MNTLPQSHTQLSAPTDAQALAAYATSSDPQAFALLTARYQRMVLATCMRVTRSQADAEDAAQETFLKLARKASEIHGSAAAWLHAAAMGTSLDLLRRKGAQARAERTANDLASMSKGSHTTDASLWNELEPALDDALATLTPEDRDAVVAHYLADRPQKQLAAEAGVSPGTMSRRIERGLDALAVQLRAKGFGVIAIGSLAAALSHGAAISPVSAAVASGSAKAALSQAALASTRTTAAAGLSGKAVALLAIAGVALAGAAGTWFFVGGGAAVNQSANGGLLLVERPTKALPLYPMSDLREGTTFTHSPTIEVTPTQIIYSVPKNWTGDKERIVLDRVSSSFDGTSIVLRVRIAEVNVERPDSPLPPAGTMATVTAKLSNGMIRMSLLADGQANPLEAFQGRFAEPLAAKQQAAVTADDPAVALMGTWSGIPNWNLLLDNETIAFVVPVDFAIEKYRILSWEAHEGFAHVEALCTTNILEIRTIGKRVKFTVTRSDDSYEVARHTLDSNKIGVFPTLPSKQGDGVRIASFVKELP